MILSYYEPQGIRKVVRATVSQRTLQSLKARIKAAAGDVEQAAIAVSRASDRVIDSTGGDGNRSITALRRAHVPASTAAR
jgi:hypothetical protein